MKRINYTLSSTAIRLFILMFVVSLVSGLSASAQTGPFYVFPPDVPATETNDGQSIEVGFKFKVTQVGTVNAIRFFKYSGNGTGTLYRVNLWTNGNSTTPGTNLATASSSTLNTTGWQSLPISSVTLYPGTVYVVSVFSSSGWYAYTNNYFPTSPDDASRPPFIMIANSTDPAGVGNGVWRYTVTSAFPINSGNATNYFVDLSFNTTFTLPVTLSDFRATTNNNNVQLNWKTEHEYYNKGFEVQRSNNGSDWYTLTFVNGVGESSTTTDYGYTDKNLAPGTYYYRLRQTDMDNKGSYTSIVNATVSGKGQVSLFQNYPNPFTSSTSIRFDLPRTQHARLALLDLSGREIRVLTDKTTEAGSHIITLDATSLVRQTYIISLRTENGILTRKITVR